MTTVDTTQASPRPPRRTLRTGLIAGLGLMLTTGVLSLSVAQAHGPGGGPGGGGPGGFMAARMQKILDQVGATDSQKAQIKATWDGLRPQLKALRQQHQQLHQQIVQAMTAPTIDTAGIEKLRQQSVQVMDKSSSLITQGFVATAQVLTPDQRKQAAAVLEQARQRHHGGWHGGPGMGGDVTE